MTLLLNFGIMDKEGKLLNKHMLKILDIFA